jgi:hypothetical protein
LTTPERAAASFVLLPWATTQISMASHLLIFPELLVQVLFLEVPLLDGPLQTATLTDVIRVEDLLLS